MVGTAVTGSPPAQEGRHSSFRRRHSKRLILGSKKNFPTGKSPGVGSKSKDVSAKPGFFTVPVCLILAISFIAAPATARAGALLDFIRTAIGSQTNALETASTANLQTLPLPRPAMNLDPARNRGGGEVIIVDNSALLPQGGPAGTIADIQKPKNGTISTYIVRKGDTVSSIARMFGVSPNTVLWANDLQRGETLRVGDTLTILPVTGVIYTVKKGDTVASIAKRFGGDAEEIAVYNGIEEDRLAVGLEIIIPDGEITAPVQRPSAQPAHDVGPLGTPSQIGYYLRPIIGGTHTQGIHGYNGVDIGAPVGTPVMASAEGDVIVARDAGWNGGYGKYVVISHANGSQTLYAHLSSVVVYDGQRAQQGQVIGYVGQSGKATGPHLHFEIRNGIRNPF